MNFLLVLLSTFAAVTAIPAERWPNLGPSKHEIVVITPTSEYTPPDYSHGITPKKDVVYHTSYGEVAHHYPPPEEKKHHYDEKLLRKYYNDYLNKKVAFKKNLIQKAVDKTVDVTAKLTQYTVDFISRVAIETAAKLAKNGAKNVLHKKEEKIIAANNHSYNLY